MVLSRSRPYIGAGFAAFPSGLSFESMDCYAKRYGIAGDEFEDFLYFLLALDGLYLEHASKEHERTSKEKVD